MVHLIIVLCHTQFPKRVYDVLDLSKWNNKSWSDKPQALHVTWLGFTLLVNLMKNYDGSNPITSKLYLTFVILIYINYIICVLKEGVSSWRKWHFGWYSDLSPMLKAQVRWHIFSSINAGLNSKYFQFYGRNNVSKPLAFKGNPSTNLLSWTITINALKTFLTVCNYNSRFSLIEFVLVTGLPWKKINPYLK